MYISKILSTPFDLKKDDLEVKEYSSNFKKFQSYLSFKMNFQGLNERGLDLVDLKIHMYFILAHLRFRENY